MMIFLCTNLMVIPVFPKVENVALKEDWLFIYMKILHIQLLHFMNDPTYVWEGQFIQISGNELSFKLLLGNVYRPPRDILHNYNTFNDEFIHVLEQLTRSKPEGIIAGDYNINLLELAKRNIVNNYFTFITSYNFYPHITLPTRFSRSNATLIDNFLCKSSKVLSSLTSGYTDRQILRPPTLFYMFEK